MDSNTLRNIIALVIVAGVALIPAFVVFNMVRPLKKENIARMGDMDMNVRGVKLPDEDDNTPNDLGSFAGRW